MKLETSVLIVVPLLALLVGKLVCLIMCDHYSGRIIYVDKKHMNITVEWCATPNLTLGFYTPMKAMKYCGDTGRKKEPCYYAKCKSFLCT